MTGTQVPDGAVIVYGATGYTGRLIATELGGSGVPLVLAGRNEAKVRALAEEVEGQPAIAAVALDDGDGLSELLKPASVVVACAGPFSLHGEPVLHAAAETGTHYLDTTGEQPFMRLVFERYGPIAERNGCALVTGMGFDYFPGDMIAALTAAGMGRLDEISLAYSVQGFGPTRGTAHSALEMMGGGDVEWLEGEWIDADTSISRGRFRFPDPIGDQRMTRYPAGEHITVPRHVETGRVRTALTASTSMPPGMAIVAPIVMPGFQLALKTPVRRGLDALIRRLPEGPAEERRRSARFTIVCDAQAGTHQRRGVISGRDVYGLTGHSLAVAALRCVQPEFDGRGALAPAQAFEPAGFLSEFADFDLSYTVEEAS